MKVPGSRGARPRSAGRGRHVVCALGAVALCCLVGGCDGGVPGHPHAVQTATESRHVDGRLPTLLPHQEQFPAGYEMSVPPPAQAVQAAGDLAGVPAGAQADPADCAPPAVQTGADQTAVAVGAGNATRATITVELTRTDRPLADLQAQVRRCGSFRVQRGPITNTVATQLDPPPPVNADDSLAWRRTVSGPVRGPGLTQSMRTLMAQIGDVRINATYLTFGAEPPDMTGLNQVFTATVNNVRKG